MRYEYDSMGCVTKRYSEDNSYVKYTYDKNDNLIKMVDAEGYTLTYTYDKNNRPVSAVDANGNKTKFTYDANGNVTAVENPDGGVEQYVYDLNDQLTSYTDGEGYTTLYAYDENGNLIKVTDPRGNSRTAEYDALNRQTVTVNEEGGRVEFSYDALGRITKVINEDGAVTEYEYDAKGRVTGIKDAYGNYKYFTYDPMDRVTSVTDENGVERKYAYDFKGNLTKYTDGLGNSETYTYDANDNRISVTNRNGETYTYTYDALDRVTSETDPKGNTKSFTYDKDSRITAVKDRNGNTTKYVLDGNGNIVESIDAAGTGSTFTYDSMDRLTKIRVHRVDKIHKVDEYQETLYTYDHRGLVKTEVNAKGDGKVFVYDGNGNLIQKTDEDGYVTEYEYSPVNLVSNINYNDAKSASYAYNGTGELVEMEDWNGKTSIGRDLLNRVVKVTDHDGRETEYGWDNVGNKTVQGYPDGTQVDYYYDAENQIVEMKDFDGGITRFEYDANGNKTFKEYPNYETAYYFYDECDRIIEMDEYDLGGKKLFKTTYSWDAEGNRLSEMQYNHGQSGTSGNGNGNKGNGNSKGTGGNAVISGALFNAMDVLGNLLEGGGTGAQGTQDKQAQSVRTTPEAPMVEIPSADIDRLSTESPIVNGMALPDPTAGTAAGVVLSNQAEAAKELNARLQNTAIEAEAPKPETPEAETDKPETGKEDASVEGNGDGNGQVPPGQTEDGDGSIVNPGGHMPPGLNRGEKGEKPNNPNKPEKPDNPGTEDNTDKQANKANKGTHKYTYDELNRMITSNIAGTTTTYTYDTLGNLVLEKSKNHVVDYQYNELNQLVQKKDGNESYTYTYDKRGNRTAEIGKKASRSYIYDETNRMVEGTNWKGDKSAYTYNGLGIRINNTHTTHAGKVYARDYVIDYTSFENDDLMVFAEGNGQLEYEQKHVYAGSERIEQFTDKGNWERTLYVHEDVMGNTRYYTKANGQSFAELTYDAWGMPVSPNKLLNNDHGNYVFATFTGHIYDTTLDIYFAEARFYDASNRTWLAMDPVKDGLNWYQYCYSNPTTYWDPSGLESVTSNLNRRVWNIARSAFNQMHCREQKNSGLGLTAVPKEKMLELWKVVGKPGNIYIDSLGGEYIQKLIYTIGGNQDDVYDIFEIARFIGYLAYGAKGITTNSKEGFFRLYTQRTLQSNGDQYYFSDLYKQFSNLEISGVMQGFGGANSTLNTYGNTNYGGQTLDPNKGTIIYNGMERYAIALGPVLQNPNWKPADGLDGKLMAYGTPVDVEIDLNGTKYYIPAIITDVKKHTGPTGIFQSGVSVLEPNPPLITKVENAVEWYTYQYEGSNNKSEGLSQFNQNGSVIIYRNEILDPKNQ